MNCTQTRLQFGGATLWTPIQIQCSNSLFGTYGLHSHSSILKEKIYFCALLVDIDMIMTGLRGDLRATGAAMILLPLVSVQPNEVTRVMLDNEVDGGEDHRHHQEIRFPLHSLQIRLDDCLLLQVVKNKLLQHARVLYTEFDMIVVCHGTSSFPACITTGNLAFSDRQFYENLISMRFWRKAVPRNGY